MVLVQFFRSGSQYNEGLDWYYNMADLMIPNTTTYLACEIVDKTGFTYGVSMLGSVLGAIPFLQSLLNMLIGLEGDVTNSSHIFTKFLGSQDGTGTSFVSDSYLAFGIMGVLVVSYYSGVIISYLKERSRDSYYHLVMYIVYCGFAIYAVRSSFLFPIRFITYSVLFAYINIKLFKYDRINHHTRI